MDLEDYARAFIATTGEIPSLVAAILCVDRLGRKLTLMGSLAATSVFLIILMFCHGYIWWETAAIFCARAAANCAFTVLYISTGEMYPTAIRTTGLGTASAMARIGGFAAPFIAAVVYDANRVIALLSLAGIGILTAAITQQLPETQGESLADEE